MDTIFVIAILMILMAAYYSLVVFPKQRNFSKHQKYVANMQVGDEVITYSGIIGTIAELDAEVGVSRVRLADGVEVRMLNAAILRPFDPAEIAESTQRALGSQTEEG